MQARSFRVFTWCLLRGKRGIRYLVGFQPSLADVARVTFAIILDGSSRSTSSSL